MSGRIEKFEDLLVWKEAMRLSVQLYRCLKDCKNYGFRDQIQRSVISIPSNIAEGFERQSNKEFIQYLYIAKGSCGELRTQLHIAFEINLVEKSKCEEYLECTRKISAMLYQLIKTRKERF
jgi:four helix bundle protein